MRKYNLHDGERGAALTIRITPRARRTEFSGFMRDGTLRIRVAASQGEGEADNKLIRYLAKVLGVQSNRIDIVAGHEKLDKIVSITGLSAEDTQKKILTWIAEKKGA